MAGVGAGVASAAFEEASAAFEEERARFGFFFLPFFLGEGMSNLSLLALEPSGLRSFFRALRKLFRSILSKRRSNYWKPAVKETTVRDMLA